MTHLLSSLNVLLIEDNPGDARLIRAMLREGEEEPVQLTHVDRLARGLERLREPGIDVLLLDLGLADSQGLQTFRTAHSAAPRLPIVVLSVQTDTDLGLRAVQEGAQDYLLKGHVDPEGLARSLRYAIEHKRIEVQRQFLLEACRKLAGSLDYEATLEQVVRLPVPFLADTSLVALLPEANCRPRLIIHDLDLTRQERVREQAERLVADLADGTAALEGLGFGAVITLPLVANGRSLGSLSLARSADRDGFGREEVRTIGDLGFRSALALDNARLHLELRGALQLRDEVLAANAHDLRSPLTGIKLKASLLRRKLRHAPASDEADIHASGLEEVEAAVGRALGLIDELLDVAALQAGRELALDREPTDLVDLTRQVVMQQQARTEFHRVCLRIRQEPLVGDWDAARLRRVLDNLVGNALKYSPRPDTITVELERDGDWALVRVRDHGVGIPSGELPRVFDRFFRGSNVPVGTRGAGMGLSGVRRIVEQHGGSVTLDSQEGAGSTFTVRLPLPRVQPEPLLNG